jgi:hypothetical protein
MTSLATVNPARLAALEFELAEAKARVREVGGWNAGPRVEMYQRADALPGTKYAWCQSFMNAGWRIATGGKIVGGMIVGGQNLLGGSASVGIVANEARKRGLIVKRPLRGDHFALQLNSDSWPDHCGQVVKVLNRARSGGSAGRSRATRAPAPARSTRATASTPAPGGSRTARSSTGCPATPSCPARPASASSGA